MTNTEKLLEISDLKLAGKIEQMDEGKLNNFIQLLNSFADNLPSIEKKIKDALNAKDNDTLAKHLTSVRDALVKINADEMAQDCDKQISRLGSEKHEKVEAYMRYFLSTLAILAADIQKAQNGESPSSGKGAGTGAKNNSGAFNIDKLLEISDLKIAGKIENMEGAELDGYFQILTSFTDNLPDHEEKINEALKNKGLRVLQTGTYDP